MWELSTSVAGELGLSGIQVVNGGGKIKSALTLALSRRERELTAVTGRDTPTCDSESYSGSENKQISSRS